MPAAETHVACTLGSADLTARLALIRQLTVQHLRQHSLDDVTLRLRYDGAAAEELATIVEWERACCAFLEFELTQLQDAVELRIEAPAHCGSSARWLFQHFLPEGQSSPPTCACGAR
jgi:hypothetical protein